MADQSVIDEVLTIRNELIAIRNELADVRTAVLDLRVSVLALLCAKAGKADAARWIKVAQVMMAGGEFLPPPSNFTEPKFNTAGKLTPLKPRAKKSRA